MFVSLKLTNYAHVEFDTIEKGHLNRKQVLKQ